MLFALALVAFADDEGMAEAADVACAPLQLTRSIPSATQTDVPVDVSPTLLFQGDCGGAHHWTFDIVDVEGSVLFTQDWVWDDSVTVVATINPSEDLPMNADLVLRATPSAVDGEWGELVEIPFSTGDSHLVPLPAGPTVEITSAVWFRNTQLVEVIADVFPADDPQHLSLLRIESPGGSFFTDATTLTDMSFGWFEGSAPDQACVQVSQIDGSGVVSEPVEACAHPIVRRAEQNGGCFGRSPSTAVVRSFMFLGVLGLLRRRKV